MKRTFVAVRIDAGKELTETISSLRSELGNEGIKWVDLSNLHTTLAFIGDTDDQLIRSISTMLENEFAGFGKINFILKGFDLFRTINNPKIIYTVIENTAGLIQAHEIVKVGLEKLKVGDTVDEMLSLIGKPTKQQRDRDGRDRWIYEKTKKGTLLSTIYSHIIVISDNKVVEIILDSDWEEAKRN